MKPEPVPSSRGVAAWWLVFAVTITALVGLVAGKILFSEVRLVEKAVEVTVEKKVEVPVEVIKTVEKRVEVPVEVVKTVEKKVEVPAEVSDYEKKAVKIVDAILDADSREIGIAAAALYPPEDKTIKVVVSVYDSAKPHLSASEIAARVESVFRREGFTVHPEDGPYSATLIWVHVNLMSLNEGRTLAGAVDVTVDQIGMFHHGGLWKRSYMSGNRYGHSLSYGSNHFHKIPGEIEALAIQAANDLAKAAKTPKKK
jgi:hypothetical protein